MPLVSALLLGVSTNLDNLFLGFSLGLGGSRITSRANWYIGLFSAAAACLFCCASELLSGWGAAARAAGGVLIVLLGLWTLRPPKAGEDAPPGQNVAALGAALAVNCVPAAFAAGLTGMRPLAASASVGLLSVLSIRAGNILGLRTARRLRPSVLRWASGLLMTALGVLQLWAG